MVKVTYYLVIALTYCAGVSSANVGERMWLEAKGEGFVTRTETAEIPYRETLPQFGYDAPPEVLWHHYEEFNIYEHSAEIGNNRRHCLTGSNANSEAQLFRILGNGTPKWVAPGGGPVMISTAYADKADVCVAVYLAQPGQLNKMCRYGSASATPLWTYTPPEGEKLNLRVGVPSNGNFVAAATSIGTTGMKLRIFEAEKGSVIDSVNVTTSECFNNGPLIITPNGRFIMFRIMYDLYIYEFNGSRLTLREKITTGYYFGYHGMSGNGEYIAYYNGDSVVVRRYENGKYSLLFEHTEPGHRCSHIAFDRAGHLFTAWDDNPTLKRPRITCHSLSPPSSTPVWTYTYKSENGPYEDCIWNLAVSEDGSRLIAASWGNSSDENPEIEIFNGSTGDFLFGIDTPGSMFCCDITPDGLYATAAGKHVHANVLDHGGDIYCIKVLDDIPVTGPESFVAKPAGDAVEVSWRGNWRELAGFNLYRENAAGAADANRVKLNDELITGRSPYRFVDRGVRAGNDYKYWLEAVDLSGARETFGPAEIELGLKPAAFALYQNAPNPARGATTFAFSLPAAGPASLAVYDLAGREVWRHDGTFTAGANELRATFELAPGVYVYRLDAAGNRAAKRMVLVR